MSGFLRDATAEEFVKAVDPSLELVESFRHFFPFNQVYKVRRGDTMYVLKTVYCKGDCDFRLLNFEREALKEVVGIQGITHLVEDYKVVNGNYSAFLKEYADGFRFSLERIPRSYRSNLKSQLEDTVKLLNGKDYFGLDIANRNLIISPDFKKITLIDAFLTSKFPPTNSDLIGVDRLFI